MHLPLPAVPPPLCLLSGRLATIHVSTRRLASSTFSPIRQERPLLFTNGEGNTLQMKKKKKTLVQYLHSVQKNRIYFVTRCFVVFFNLIYSLKLSNAARRQQGRRSGVNPACAGVVKPLDWKPPNQTERAFY